MNTVGVLQNGCRSACRFLKEMSLILAAQKDLVSQQEESDCLKGYLELFDI